MTLFKVLIRKCRVFPSHSITFCEPNFNQIVSCHSIISCDGVVSCDSIVSCDRIVSCVSITLFFTFCGFLFSTQCYKMQSTSHLCPQFLYRLSLARSPGEMIANVRMTKRFLYPGYHPAQCCGISSCSVLWDIIRLSVVGYHPAQCWWNK